MRKFAGCLFVLCTFLLASPAMAQKLTKAEFFSRTDGDNKDHDTGVYVTVVTNDTKTALADVTNADNSENDGTEYNNQSEHTIALAVKSSGSTKAECAKFKFKVGAKANGKDKWKIEKAYVTLYFDDGTNLRQETGGFDLESKDSKLTESDWKGGA